MPFQCTVDAVEGGGQLNFVTSASLYSLHLNGNMTSAVVELDQLRKLDVGVNSIFSVADLPPSLTSLNLENNSLERLPPLCQLTLLTALDVSNNFIKQEFPRCITNLPLRLLQISVRRGRQTGRGGGSGGADERRSVSPSPRATGSRPCRRTWAT